jgi:hypothetical protein
MGRRHSLRAAGAALVLAITAGVTTGVQPTHPGALDPTLFSPVTVTDQPVIRDFRTPPKPQPRAPQAAQPTAIVVVPATPKPDRQESTPGKFPSVAEARAYARAKLGSTQFACLDQIGEHESGWRTHALNKSSGAYGIPQALPGSKMAVIADDWRDNPVTQVKWMIRYVNGRYGSACQAWSFWQGHSWY